MYYKAALSASNIKQAQTEPLNVERKATVCVQPVRVVFHKPTSAPQPDPPQRKDLLPASTATGGSSDLGMHT